MSVRVRGRVRSPAALCFVFAVLGGLLLNSCTSSQVPQRAVVPPADTLLPTAALHEDLEVLVASIDSIHPAFADSTAQTAAFHAAAKRLQAGLTRPMTPTDFYLRIAPLVNRLHDDHTFVGLPPAVRIADTSRVFPFDIAFADRAVVVLRTYGPASLAPGTRIVAIGGVPVSRLRDRFATLMPGTRPAHRLRRLEGPTDTFKAMLQLVYGMKAPYKVAYLDAAGRRRHTTVAGVFPNTIRVRRDSLDGDGPTFTYRRIGTETGLLKIQSFSARRPGYDAVLETAFEDRSAPGSLIIDLRGNAGGSSGRAEALLRYLTPAPVRLIDTVDVRASAPFRRHMKRERIPAGLRWLPVQYLSRRGRAIWGVSEGAVVSFPEETVSPRPVAERFGGDVYVLVDEETASSASIFAAAVQETSIGVLVGRETGGPAGATYAQHLPVRLPHSGLHVRIASMRFRFGEPVADGRPRGVVPDHRVPRAPAAWATGRDPVLERARTLAATPRTRTDR